MRDKCKLCKELNDGVCLVYNRARSAGKKRWCIYFDPLPLKQKMFTPHLRYRSKAELRREKLQRQLDLDKRKEMQKILDQEKLKSVSGKTGIKDSSVLKEKVTIKKPSIFKRFFRKVIP